jgi:hypothetical protein
MILPQLLAALIAFCPLVCEAESVNFRARDHDACHRDSSPTPCSDESNGCICQGAIQAGSVRVDVPDLTGQILQICETIPSVAPSLAPLVSLGVCQGFGILRPGGCPQAALQNFRC